MAWQFISYNGLTRGFLNRQRVRFLRVLAILRQRSQTVAPGRLVPDQTTLAIGRGRRLDAAVLFLDICDFSSRPAHEHADQERMLRALTIFFSEMIAIVEDHDGTVEKNTGDGLMAYFVRSGGVDGAVKAVAASLSMMDAAARHIDPLFLSEGVQPFQFRVTIDRGSLTIANVGRKIGFSGILAIGTTANMASKMLSVAPPMSIVLGTNVLPYLPEAWLQYAHLLTDNWGWTDQTGQPYRLWEYKGRWVDPPRPAAGGFFGAGY